MLSLHYRDALSYGLHQSSLHAVTTCRVKRSNRTYNAYACSFQAAKQAMHAACRRPTYRPAMRLSHMPPRSPEAAAKRGALQAYLAALADLAAPKKALCILRDQSRLRCFDAVVHTVLRRRPGATLMATHLPIAAHHMSASALFPEIRSRASQCLHGGGGHPVLHFMGIMLHLLRSCTHIAYLTVLKSLSVVADRERLIA